MKSVMVRGAASWFAQTSSRAVVGPPAVNGDGKLVHSGGTISTVPPGNSNLPKFHWQVGDDVETLKWTGPPDTGTLNVGGLKPVTQP